MEPNFDSVPPRGLTQTSSHCLNHSRSPARSLPHTHTRGGECLYLTNILRDVFCEKDALYHMRCFVMWLRGYGQSTRGGGGAVKRTDRTKPDVSEPSGHWTSSRDFLIPVANFSAHRKVDVRLPGKGEFKHLWREAGPPNHLDD